MTRRQRRIRPSLPKVAFVIAALIAALGLAACGPTPVAGQVTSTGSGDPLPGVSVQAFSATSESLVAEVVTGTDGTYGFGSDLPDGTYRLRFGRTSWHGGAAWSSADDVVVSAEVPATIDHAFTQVTGSIAGSVTVLPDPASIGTYTVDVRNIRSGWSKRVQSPPETSSSQAWIYTVGGLPAGDYTVRVQFNRYVGDSWAGNLAWSYAPSAHLPSDAEVITVGPGGQTTGVDVAISSDTFDLRVYTEGDWTGAAYSIFVLDEDGELLVPLVGTPNDSRYRGLPRIPFRLLVVSWNQAIESHVVGATAENPLGTLHPADTGELTISPPG